MAQKPVQDWLTTEADAVAIAARITANGWPGVVAQRYEGPRGPDSDRHDTHGLRKPASGQWVTLSQCGVMAAVICPPERIEIVWSPPMPDPVPGMRHDPGGYIYRLYRDGKLLMSGSAHHETAEAVGARAARYAAEKGLHDLPAVILSRNPLEVAP